MVELMYHSKYHSTNKKDKNCQNIKFINKYLHLSKTNYIQIHKNITNWNFDHRLYQSNDLIKGAVYIYKMIEMDKILKKKETQIYYFCTDVAKRYLNIPYHNFRHGISVLHLTYMIYQQRDKIIYKNVTINNNILMLLALFISALCHDVAHDGKTNDIHIKNSKSKLVLKYGQFPSLLEKLHISVTNELIDKHKFLSDLSMTDQLIIKKYITEFILATDLKFHKKLMNEVDINIINNINHINNKNDIKIEITLCKLVLHCADVANATMKTELMKYWTEALMEEFRIQDNIDNNNNNNNTYSNWNIINNNPNIININHKRKANELNIKKKQHIIQEAIGHLKFIKLFTYPSWTALTNVIPENKIKKCFDNIQINEKYWQEKAKNCNSS